MASDKSRKRVAKKYGDMPDKWDDWHVRLPDPKDQIRVIDLYHKSGSMSKSEFVRARLREFGIRKGLKKLVISSKIRIFIGENQ